VLDELKIRYKELSLRKRLALCFLLSLIPAIYIYFDQASTLDEEYEQADNAEKTAAAQLLQADNQLKNLQKTENELEYTKDQLKKAEARLPDNVHIDEVLRTTGKLAKESAVSIQLFEPRVQIVKGDEYKYIEVPLRISVEAPEYSQICDWIDAVAGLKTKMYLKSWTMTRKKVIAPMGGMGGDIGSRAAVPPSMRAEEDGRQARRQLRLTLEGDFSLYKLASAEDIAKAAALDAAGKPGLPGKPIEPAKPQTLPGLNHGSVNPAPVSPSRIDEKGGAA
jgi:Tfp pilus assembly protein PilO